MSDPITRTSILSQNQLSFPIIDDPSGQKKMKLIFLAHLLYQTADLIFYIHRLIQIS